MNFINKVSKNKSTVITIAIGVSCLCLGLLAGNVMHVTTKTKLPKDNTSKENKSTRKAPLDLNALMKLSAKSVDSGDKPKAKDHVIQKTQKVQIQTPNTTKNTPAKQNTNEKSSSDGFFSNLLHKKPTTHKKPQEELPKTANVEHSKVSFQILTNEIVLHSQDIKNIQISHLADNGYGIQINLTDDATNRLKSFTGSHLNKPCQFVINDTVISLAVIQSPLGGAFIIPASNKAKAVKIYNLLVK
jgi:preprotein translocase subunit SecD